MNRGDQASARPRHWGIDFSRARLRESGWVIYLAGAGAVSVPYLALHGTVFNSGPVFNLLGVSSIVAITLGAFIHPVPRLPWLLAAGGMVAFVAGDVLAYNYKRFFGVELPFPSVADGFYLAVYPFLIAWLVMLVRRRTPAHDRAALIDALIVSTAAGALSWALLIAPYAHDNTLSFGTKLTSIAYPIMDLGVAACVARLAFGHGRRCPSFAFLTIGVLSLLGADSVYGWMLLHGGYQTGGLLDAGWIVFYVFVGMAALHPSVPALVEPVPDTQYRLTRRRIASLAACATIAPAVLAVEGSREGVRDVPLLAACSGAVFLMVILRLLDLSRRHEAALRRATVLATTGAGLVEAQTVADVAAVASSAGQKMLGAGAVVRIEVGALESERAGAEGDLIRLPLQGLRERHGSLIAEKAGTSDADTLDGLRALAHEVALALDGVNMADQLLKRRTEARFQSLVQHSSDAVLLIDESGRVDYASPSTDHVLAAPPAELENRLLLDLVSEQDRTRVMQAVFGSSSSTSAHALEFELTSRRGNLEVEAVCTNLLDNEDIAGIVLNIRDISERKDFERQLAHQAFHDEITGLANRALFRDRVEHALERVRRGSSLAVLFVDLDDFKAVNDTLGHQAGDRLIEVVAGRISATARAVDTAARLGGDEFAILLEDAGDEVAAVTGRLLTTISEPIEIDGRELMVSASIGIAHAEALTEISADTLLRNADVAMYAAKGGGKGTCRSFESEMHSALLERLELKRELQIALDRDEFELEYQPIVDLATGEFVSVEALIRWRHPERGLVPPDQFISLAEESGAILAIGSWVLEQACHEAAKLIRIAGPAAPSMCVNVSGRQLPHADLVRDVMDVLDRTGLPPEKLVLEITETAMIAELDVALNRLHELSACGVRLAVDDFGSGYSSLNYIRRFPINILKIDRSFIAEMHEASEVASLARTIIDLAAILDVTPVAEGIERPDQLEELRRLGCALGQGFLFMAPVPAAELEREIIRRLARPMQEGLIA